MFDFNVLQRLLDLTLPNAIKIAYVHVEIYLSKHDIKIDMQV